MYTGVCWVLSQKQRPGHGWATPTPSQNADPAPGLPVGSQQDVPGQEVFPTKQRETRFSEGLLGDIGHTVHARTSQCKGYGTWGRKA